MFRSLSHIVGMDEVKDLESFYSKFRASPSDNLNSKTLDLGCGGVPRNPFQADLLYGIDIRDSANPNIARADLAQERIPHGDASMDYITAFDFIEHVPRVVYLPQIRYSFIELMNEVYRILTPGGLFLAQTPVYPFSACFTDPTHVNPITSETFSQYFDDQRQWGRMYGFNGAFKIESQVRHSTHLISILRKV
ncbi:methyltransferase domain-containing protein [Polynucleobacter sp.]|uniref:methyltransferase domain-containing protein n=1 Tax=Polynucleobacter sp. TaxID=2029855 RepID=UPI003F69D206